MVQEPRSVPSNNPSCSHNSRPYDPAKCYCRSSSVFLVEVFNAVPLFSFRSSELHVQPIDVFQCSERQQYCEMNTVPHNVLCTVLYFLSHNTVLATFGIAVIKCNSNLYQHCSENPKFLKM
jgi:hypothetical protein